MCKGLDIPAFLRRKRGEKSTPIEVPPPAWSNATQASSWAKIDETKKRKARGRIGKMKAKKADQAARKDGKTWDAVHGGWK
jgi:hypothetical protein